MTLPVLVTVPHGGRGVPPEAASCLLSPYEIALDGDTWASELYAFDESVYQCIGTSIPRAIVDLNRAPDDLPPANPDGVVKSRTVDGTRIWPNVAGPGPELTRILLERYHAPWHETVTRAANAPGLVLGLDCHTMLAIGPPGHAFTGRSRPLFCLGNRGNANGTVEAGDRLSAPTDLLLLLRDNLALVLQNEDVEIEIDEPRFRLNVPFRGGHIIRHHSTNTSVPWIQLELSRALYLPSHFEPTPGVADLRRLADLRGKILQALRRTI